MDPPPLSESETAHLLTLAAVRERCTQVYDAVARGDSPHLALHLDRLPDCVARVRDCIARRFRDPASIPAHTRWRHYEARLGEVRGAESEQVQVDRIETLLRTWKAAGVGRREQTKRVLDLMTVSVLLDAGAGDIWKYKDPMTEQVWTRSEGLAIAVYNMFLMGTFSSQKELHPCQVDATALKTLTVDTLKHGFQVTEHNPLVGLESRCTLLCRLGNVLETTAYFQSEHELARPGNMIDTLCPATSTSPAPIPLDALWRVLLALHPAFPARATAPGRLAHADVFYSRTGSTWVAFHKLTQWLAYTLAEVLARVLGTRVTDTHALTGLAEYRNGGLLVDTGVLAPRSGTRAPRAVDDALVVEWRACTIVLLDRIADTLRQELGVPELSLAAVLEGGTWKAGREIAKKLRPENGSPPIQIISDGTIF